MQKKVFRIVYYLFGLVVLTIGITLNSKTSLGVSPLVSIAFAVAKVFNLKFGTLTFVVYVFFILIQILLLRKNFRKWDLLQIVIAFLSSQLINLWSEVLPAAATMPGRLLELVVAVALTGTGAAIMLTMEGIPNPADGMVAAVADSFHIKTGLAKNICDATMVAVTLIFSLVMSGHIIGVGLGTVITVLLCGRVMAVYYRFAMNPMRALAGLPPRALVKKKETVESNAQ